MHLVYAKSNVRRYTGIALGAKADVLGLPQGLLDRKWLTEGTMKEEGRTAEFLSVSRLLQNLLDGTLVRGDGLPMKDSQLALCILQIKEVGNC